MQQLLSGVAYLHDNWVIHRDLVSLPDTWGQQLHAATRSICGWQDTSRLATVTAPGLLQAGRMYTMGSFVCHCITCCRMHYDSQEQRQHRCQQPGLGTCRNHIMDSPALHWPVSPRSHSKTSVFCTPNC